MKFSGRRTIVSLLLLSTMFVGAAVTASPASATTRRGPTASEAQMLRLINASRRANGRAPLAYNANLSSSARMHSALMARAGTIFHTSNLAYVFRKFSWTTGGENVGMGPGMVPLHWAFMASLHHRENILDRRFHRVGIGVIWKNGVAYATIEFLS